MMVNAQPFAGDWKGAISVQGMELELIFHIAEDNGTYATTLDIPMQGAAGIPVEKTEVEGSKLTLNMSALQARYEGTLNVESIEGTFKQMGQEFSLVLKKFESKLPGNPALVSSDEELQQLVAYDAGNYKYRVEDYFSRPKASSFQLSPDGKYMSYREKEDGSTKRHVYVKEIATGKVTRILEEKDELIRGYFWKNNERLLYMMDQGGNEQYHIHAVNVDGSNNVDLTPYEGVQAGVVSILKDQKDYVIVQMNKNNKQVFEPYKLNVVTGEMEQLYENKDIANPIQGYDFDKDGNLRGYSRLVNGVESEQWYKDLATGEFKLVKQMKWYDSFGIAGFNYDGKNPDEAYVVTNLDSDKARIVLYDFKKNSIVKEVFSNPDYDVANMSRSRKRNYEIDYFAYNGEKYVITPVSDFFKSFTKQMEKEFPGKEFYVVDSDDDENTFLIVVQSDKLYGTYYQYDNKTKQFSLLYDLMPQLKEADMAEMRPITFTSRDGLTIHGYITLPKEALTGEKVPLVVNPHGGPQGIRDEWGFNPETQLFASRGYATLQVNFRISGGYGKEFLKAGFKQVGRKVMDDVEDGVKYVIEQGWVDKDKMAIYGGSHGGYATLMGLVKTPDLYACGVDYVGVSNIFTFMNSIPEYWKPYLDMLKEIWYDIDNEEEAAIAREASPAYQIDKIKSPLFVVQGANDPRVNINESDQIVEKLRAKGVDVPYMVKYNEGHGFAHEENSIDFYKAMLGFLAKYLK
ncbi:MAG: S9 family peptidase [Bacteroidales bacterium]|nr:S9 family peptidase [Bacteroidales bacterium]MBP8981590.1 S9 family peptidase [Bacteroidales bacterium]OQC04025.1 MAG: Prolyl tripeptidyl peptidase precursor [Bacteroidetes bacterium ADurb.Bin090]HOH23471.1 S9 family peptidase [Bacteroidales bacterium]HQB70976.1 S9 family peptidase [Bacteroidales bacterium]